MWILLALVSALCLGFYDIFKKLSVRDNDVLMVLMLNTVFGALLMSPFLLSPTAISASATTPSAMRAYSSNRLSCSARGCSDISPSSICR